MAEFRSWPEISRLARDVVVTEKIDGQNGAIHIERLKFSSSGELTILPGDVVEHDNGNLTFMRLTAQSRTRLISVKDDMHGFARWVTDNAAGLAVTLGEGTHYGEWWGYKINRGYGLSKGDRRFSLFNTERWAHLDGSQVQGLYVVPVLTAGLLFDTTGFDSGDCIPSAIEMLEVEGSRAAPGYDRPEGIVVFHTAGRVMFKFTLDGDENKTATPVKTFANRGVGADSCQRCRAGRPAKEVPEQQEEILTTIESEDYTSNFRYNTTDTPASGRAGYPLWDSLV